MKQLFIGGLCLMITTAVIAAPRGRTEKQPLMSDALTHLTLAKSDKDGDGKKIKYLNDAKAVLQKATQANGGYRVTAIEHIDKALDAIKAKKIADANKMIQNAINDVRRGNRYDSRH